MSNSESSPRKNIPEKSVRTQKRLDRLAKLSDSFIPLPGPFRMGLDSIIGLIPFVGDAFSSLLSMYIIGVGVRSGAPKVVTFRMFLNSFLDLTIGSIPLLGDLFDLIFRANEKNVALIQKYVLEPEKAKRSSQAVLLGIVATLFVLFCAFIYLNYLIFKWFFSLF